ncbi:hypothetical protein [Roseiconus lacunae]|uniref:hypothetical protein n=1 Tax=Roseiconus lacunae TaxID=2605694 RepID=UPI0011F2F67E|nr:hypothetical protein [Roseiconus lacunae]MCD0460989.1 hypothetical protein [Roseiconus lacunae]
MVRVFHLLFVVCIATAVLQTQSVQASCGDWLDHSGIVHSRLGASDERPIEFPSPADLPAKPCDGPSCHGVPLSPMAVSMTDSITVRDYETVAAVRRDDHGFRWQRHVFFYDELQLVIPAHAERIERPPRS